LDPLALLVEQVEQVLKAQQVVLVEQALPEVLDPLALLVEQVEQVEQVLKAQQVVLAEQALLDRLGQLDQLALLEQHPQWQDRLGQLGHQAHQMSMQQQ
jgi:hypothetical protein